MAGPSPRQSIYTIACRCGAYTAIHIRHFGRTQVCRVCKNSYTVAWRKNAQTGQSTPVVITLAKTREQHRSTHAGEIVGWMICSCGYKRPALAGDTRKTIRCPGCDRYMYFEKSGGQKPSGSTPAIPAPTAPPASRPPSQSLVPVKGEAVGILCSCGERLGLRPDLVGREARCPGCGQVMRLDGRSTEHVRALFLKTPTEPEPLPWLDYLDGRPAPAARRPPSRFVTAALPSPPPPASPEIPAPPPPPPGPPAPRPGTFACPCGHEIELWATQPGKDFPCPACGRTIKLEKRRDPQTLVTMLLPTFSAPPAQAPPPPPPQRDPESIGDPGPPSSKVYPAARDEYVQEVICDCGEALIVGREDVGRHVQCPSCGVMMEVIPQKDNTLTVRVLGRLTEGSWSLEDFQ